MDFLVSPRRRLMYAILFAVMGTSLINGYGEFGATFDLDGINIYTSLLNKVCESFIQFTLSSCDSFYIVHPAQCGRHSSQ